MFNADIRVKNVCFIAPYPLDMITFTIVDNTTSHIPINMDRMVKDTKTTMVEPMSSSLVDQETFPISSFTSFRKLTNLLVIAN